jgi:hypothetical protein
VHHSLSHVSAEQPQTRYEQLCLELDAGPREAKRLRARHEALESYLDLDKLRTLAATSGQRYAALRNGNAPAEGLALIELLAAPRYCWRMARVPRTPGG